MINENRAVLVTGGAGYIGSHAALALRDAGIRVVVLDDLSTGTEAAVPAGVTLIRGSTADTNLIVTLVRLYDIDAVMHFAGSLVVPESVVHPIAYWRNNVANTMNLAEACVLAGVEQLVFSSTAAVYGLSDAAQVDEDTVPAPINPYGTSKLAAEHLLADVSAAHGIRVAVLRYFNVAGADPDGRAGQRTVGATHLIKVACEVATGQRAGMSVFGCDYDTVDGTCVRDFIHVSDLAEAHVLALRYLRGGGTSTTLNCGYGQGQSVRAVIEAVERLSGATVELQAMPRRAGDPPALVAQADRIRTVLGWEPRHTGLDEILGSSLAWERRMIQERTFDRAELVQAISAA